MFNRIDYVTRNEHLLHNEVTIIYGQFWDGSKW